MQPYLVLLEFAIVALFICAIHGMRHRIGLVPIYVIFGLLEAFLFFAGMGDPTTEGRPMIQAQLYGSEPSQVASLLFLPLLLSVMVMVYILDGTREARRLILALILAYVMHGVFEVLLHLHAWNPPPGKEVLENHPLASLWLPSRGASLGAVLLDALSIVIVYQFIRNKLPKLPLVFPLFLGLVAAMLMDSVAYSGLHGLFTGEAIGTEGLRLPEKFQAGIAAAVPVSSYIAWQIKKHGGQLTRESLGRGAFDIVDMSVKMKQLEERFESLKGTFSKYVSPAVVEQIVKDPNDVELGGELRDVTIMFSDIRGYSTLSESLGPSELIGILNRYFQQVAPCVLNRGGMINEFEGDGILAVFGAPMGVEDHASKALEAAVDMQIQVEELNRIWEADGTANKWKGVGLDNLAVRVGIHTGDVVAGNIGTDLRMKYAVIGDTVNTAARVEGLNKTLSTNILITDTTRERLRIEGTSLSSLRDMGAHQVKGKGDKVHVYTYALDSKD
jgi:class 3 adenylate cyclase